jgi:hypothetical protein
MILCMTYYVYRRPISSLEMLNGPRRLESGPLTTPHWPFRPYPRILAVPDDPASACLGEDPAQRGGP